MAVRRWELEDLVAGPVVSLVDPPVRRGRPVIAATFVLLLICTLAAPIALGKTPAPVAPSAPRTIEASSITSLDRFRPFPGTRQPKSAAPAPGILFVSCTHLWSARSDGSGAHRLLDMPGVTSPTFSPSARTIAFFASSGAGQALYLASATGTHVTRVGSLSSDGRSLDAGATGLQWSPDGKRLAFALVTPAYDYWSGGSEIWTLSLGSGRFRRVGSGAPTPSYVVGRLMFAEWIDGKPRLSLGPNANRIFVGRSARAIALAPGRLSTPGMDVAVVRVAHGRSVFKLRHNLFRHRPGLLVRPPSGERVPNGTEPALTQDGTVMYSTLKDRSGQLDLGIYDIARRHWSVRNYAWSAATSPAPTATGGRLGARRAVTMAGELVRFWGRGAITERLLTGGPVDKGLIPFEHQSYATGDPTKIGRGWSVPILVYGSGDRGHTAVYRDIDVRVQLRGTRLKAHPIARGPVVKIETIPQAIALLQKWVTSPVVAPVLPAGTTLSRYAISMWTYRGQTTGQLQLRLPPGGSTDQGPAGPNVTLAFGAAYFSGCGGIHAEPLRLGDQPALSGSQTGFNSIVWPATRRSYRNSNGAEFGVSGDVRRKIVLDFATQMEARS
ncbi:MAG: hypothetical protein QOF16_147 [Actinomycetota bacterium]|nr:hypothetical protein [Actinomycetota bacterium]